MKCIFPSEINHFARPGCRNPAFARGGRSAQRRAPGQETGHAESKGLLVPGVDPRPN
jgi:hypothetical protein